MYYKALEAKLMNQIIDEWKLSEEEAMSVIDKFNKVDMINPISFEELQKAMSRSAEDIRLGNLNYEEILSYITMSQKIGNNNYCKLYVSDWIIKITEQDFTFNQIKDETIKYYADGLVDIILTNATIDTDFFSKIKENMNIDIVIQEYEMRNISDGEDYKFKNTFYGMKFQSVDIVHHNVNEDCAVVNIILSNR